MDIMTIAIAILIFGFLVIIHEFGHFITAKLSGVVVNEFAIGMGPKLFGYKGKETLYTLRLIPLGGFCSMQGEDEKDYKEGSFNSKGKLTRIIVLAAGSIMNIIGCFILLVIIFMILGVPGTTLDNVEEDYPAYEVGLRRGDKVISIDGKKVKSWDDITEMISSDEEGTYTIEVLRDNEKMTFDVPSKLDQNIDKYRVGISTLREKNLLMSIKNALLQTYMYAKLIIMSIGQLFTGAVSADTLTGPIGIVSVVGQSVQYGLTAVLNLAAVISINLAIFNLLPIPALDGSRIIFVIIEAIKGSPIDPEKEGLIHMIGFSALIAIAIFVAYNDILRLR